jgi:hypothetical protein
MFGFQSTIFRLMLSLGLAGLLCAASYMASAQSTALGKVSIKYSNSAVVEQFEPNEGPFYKNLGMLKNRDQFQAGWRKEHGAYGTSDYRMIAISMTAPKDGSAIQGMVLNIDRSKGFLLLEAPCVLNQAVACDPKSAGVELDITGRQVVFKNARFANPKYGKDDPSDWPQWAILNGSLRF